MPFEKSVLDFQVVLNENEENCKPIPLLLVLHEVGFHWGHWYVFIPPFSSVRYVS